MEKWNGVEIPDSMVDKLINNCEENSSREVNAKTVIDLFRTFNLRIKTFVLAITWMVSIST